MKYFILMLAFWSGSAQASEVCSIVNGAKLLAQNDENTYLGEITNRYASDSVLNEYGIYGSEYSLNSIWNKYSTFGSEYSS